MIRKYLIYMLFGFALGCSENGSRASEAHDQDGVFDAQFEAIDKAKSVEQQIQDAAAKQRQAIED